MFPPRRSFLKTPLDVNPRKSIPPTERNASYTLINWNVQKTKCSRGWRDASIAVINFRRRLNRKTAKRRLLAKILRHPQTDHAMSATPQLAPHPSPHQLPLRKRVHAYMLLTIVTCLVLLIALLLVSCSERRRALLSCIHCGNTREIQLAYSLWKGPRVRCIDYIVFATPEDHVHRWFQYNSKRQTFMNYTGWTRDKYESGDWNWPGTKTGVTLTRSPESLTEEWLR